MLRERRIQAVLRERADEHKHRLRRGSAGGRPVRCDTELYRGRNVVDRFYESFKHWHGPATRYDDSAVISAAARSCAASVSGCTAHEDTRPSPALARAAGRWTCGR